MLKQMMVSLLSTLFMICGISSAEEKAVEPFEVGQEWFYKHREGEDQSTIHIFEIVSAPDGRKIMSISFSDIELLLHRKGKAPMQNMPHIPIFEETLRSEVTKLAPKDYKPTNHATTEEEFEGHNTWKVIFDEGNAGAFTIPLAEILDIIQESTLNHAKEQPDYEFQG